MGIEIIIDFIFVKIFIIVDFECLIFFLIYFAYRLMVRYKTVNNSKYWNKLSRI